MPDKFRDRRSSQVPMEPLEAHQIIWVTPSKKRWRRVRRLEKSKETGHIPKSSQVAAPKSNIRRIVLLSMLLLSLGTGHGAWYLLTRNGPQATDALIGVWHTSDDPYANRLLRITDTHVDFGQDDGQWNSNPIDRVFKHQTQADTVRYTVTFAERSSIAELSLLYVAFNGGEVRLASRPEAVWSRPGRGWR